MKQLRALFAGGGTGGHLSPARAIADALKAAIEPDGTAEIRFVGTKRGIEYRIKDKLGYPLSLITVRGLSRRGIVQNIMFPFLLLLGLSKSIYLLIRYKIDIVIGTGGYVMGPVVMAAIALNRHCVIQEQNSYPGLTTRQLAARVDKVFLGFSDAEHHLSRGCDIVESGNPVGDKIGSVSKEESRQYFGFKPEDKVIFVFGGSQGAKRINDNIKKHLKELPEGYQLIWQTGERDYKDVAALAGGRVTGRSLFSFTHEIEKAYAAADIVICRAGALTLAELEMAERPSLLIPFPYATGDHQRKNGESFVVSGASVMIDDAQLDEVNLLEKAVMIIKDGRCHKMTEAIRNMRQKRVKPATEIIVENILTLTGFGDMEGENNN